MSKVSPYIKRDTGSGIVSAEDDKDIIPRDIRFDIPDNAKRYWFGDDLFKTVMIDCFSIFLPEGERFFIRSLKHFSSQLADRDLAAEINGYAIQEAFHTREHESYNRAMAALGYDVAKMEEPVGAILAKITDPVLCVALTCAIEHLTASFSTVMLRDLAMLEHAAPAYRRLWIWHALEELEHKAVAFDVLKAATLHLSAWKRYMLRVTVMNAFLAIFYGIYFRNVRVYAGNDGIKTNLRFWSRLLWTLFVSPGFFGRTLLRLMSYYLPNFDPRNSDDHQLVQTGRGWLDRDLATVG